MRRFGARVTSLLSANEDVDAWVKRDQSGYDGDQMVKGNLAIPL